MIQTKKLLAAAVVMSAALGAYAGGVSAPADSAGAARVGAAAPGFTLQDQNGAPISLSDFKGKVVVLEWFNPDCPFVKRHYEAGTMTDLAAKYREQGVVWLAINSTYTADSAENRTFLSAHKATYPGLDDHEGKVAREYGARTTPDMFIIDRNGVLVYAGAIDDDPRGEKQGQAVNYVGQALDAVLAGKAVATPETKSYGCSVKYKK